MQIGHKLVTVRGEKVTKTKKVCYLRSITHNNGEVTE